MQQRCLPWAKQRTCSSSIRMSTLLLPAHTTRPLICNPQAGWQTTLGRVRPANEPHLALKQSDSKPPVVSLLCGAQACTDTGTGVRTEAILHAGVNGRMDRSDIMLQQLPHRHVCLQVQLAAAQLYRLHPGSD